MVLLDHYGAKVQSLSWLLYYDFFCKAGFFFCSLLELRLQARKTLCLSLHQSLVLLPQVAAAACRHSSRQCRACFYLGAADRDVVAGRGFIVVRVEACGINASVHRGFAHARAGTHARSVGRRSHERKSPAAIIRSLFSVEQA